MLLSLLSLAAQGQTLLPETTWTDQGQGEVVGSAALDVSDVESPRPGLMLDGHVAPTNRWKLGARAGMTTTGDYAASAWTGFDVAAGSAGRTGPWVMATSPLWLEDQVGVTAGWSTRLGSEKLWFDASVPLLSVGVVEAPLGSLALMGTELGLNAALLGRHQLRIGSIGVSGYSGRYRYVADHWLAEATWWSWGHPLGERTHVGSVGLGVRF